MNTWSEFSLHARFSPSIWLQTCSINKRGGPEAPAEAPEVPGRAPDADFKIPEGNPEVRDEVQMLREELNRLPKMLFQEVLFAHVKRNINNLHH